MVGLVVVTVVQNHRLDLRLDVGLLLGRNVVLGIQRFIGPSSIPSLRRNPGVRGIQCILRNLPKRDEEAEEPARVVRLRTPRCAFTVESKEKVRLGAYRRRWGQLWFPDYLVRYSIPPIERLRH